MNVARTCFQDWSPAWSYLPLAINACVTLETPTFATAAWLYLAMVRPSRHSYPSEVKSLLVWLA